MRIKGQGSGFFGHSGPKKDRAKNFRNKRKVGDVVSGVMIKWDAGGLGWVNIEGDILLAQVQAQTVLGQALVFKVLALYPDIVLKEITKSFFRGRETGDMARDFASARTDFEKSAANFIASPGLTSLPVAGRKESFFSGLARDETALQNYASMLGAQNAINAKLDEKFGGSVRFLYVPWLFPGATDMEMLFKSMHVEKNADGEQEDHGFSELAVCMRLPNLGHGHLRFLYKQEVVGVKLFLENMDHASKVENYLNQVDTGLGLDLNILKIEPLKPYLKKSLLSGLVPQKIAGTKGLNIVV